MPSLEKFKSLGEVVVCFSPDDLKMVPIADSSLPLLSTSSFMSIVTTLSL